MSATEAARNFSEVLTRVAAGEEIAITRNGATVAVIGPPRLRFASPGRLRMLRETAPLVDGDFRAELREIRESIGRVDPHWPS